MPLITLTTKPEWHPTSGVKYVDLELKPREIVDFGCELPLQLMKLRGQLQLEPSTTPVTIQVSHRAANTHDVNVPDLWIEMHFNEDTLDEEARTLATSEIKKLVCSWFWYYMPREIDTLSRLLERFDVACDIYWPNGHHGFLVIR
ncbi:hypothetical protein IT415_01190 [bacterium]|nr:hypothetical protein [bacterium]